VIKPGEPALSRARLAHVDQYYVRAENHAAANGVLIDAQAQIPIARAWGGGLLASVDGLRFVVPVRTINAGPSPKYFGYKRGITWLNAVNDQVAGIGQMVVPGTPRDSLFILDTLLNLDAIVESLRGSGQPVRDEAVARLSPLGHAHLNCLGRYAFTTQPPAELRPLRDPNARDGEDDGEF
jgi:TnpA family transposase